MVGVFAAGRLLSRPAKDGAPATGGGGTDPSTTPEIEILTRSGDTILTRDGSTVIARAS